MIPAFRRLAASVLAHLGEDALLRGEVTLHKVLVERDVQMVDRQGNVYIAQYIVKINVEDLPIPGDALEVGNDSFVLETLVDTNGYTSRFTARKT